MGKKGIAALIIALSLFCAAGLIGFIYLMKTAAQKREARELAARVRADEERERALALEKEATKADLAAAFTDPQPPTPEEAAEFAPLFKAMGRALDRGDGAAVDRLCDFDRLLDDVVRLGGGRVWPGGTDGFRRDFRAEHSSWLGEQLLNDKTARWKQVEIRRIRWSPDRREAVLVTTHRDETDETRRWRWWMVRRGNEWKMYDNEDVLMGIRGCSLLAAGATPDMIEFNINNPGKYIAAINALRQVEGALGERKNLVEAERLIDSARGIPLPDDYMGLMALYEGRIHYERGQHDEALRQLELAERHAPSMYTVRLWRAAVLSAATRHAEALEVIQAYVAELGPDPDSWSAEGYALEGLGRIPDALKAYRRALDEGPNQVTAFHGLRRLLPNGQKGELVERLAKTRDPRKAYDEQVREARRDGDDAAVNALLDGLRQACPDDPRGLGDDIRRQVTTEKFAEAAKLMERGLKLPKRDGRESVLDAYLFAMLEAQKPLEAYAAVPKADATEAFRTLADDLESEIFDDDDEPGMRPKQTKQLRELIAAHRKRVPGDAWLHFYEAALHQSNKEYEEAAKLFAAGAAKLPPPKVEPGDEPTERDWETDRFRSRRVECLFKLKKGLEAYRDVGPVTETFSQLAGLYDRAKDFDGLTALLAAHREAGVRDPERTYWQARLFYRKADYARAVLVYHKYLDESNEKARMQWAARDELLRCVLRTTPTDARKTLEQIGADKVPLGMRATVAAATSDRAELERILGEVTKNGGKAWFYSDEDFRRFIYQDQYRDLRTKYPDPTPPSKQEG